MNSLFKNPVSKLQKAWNKEIERLLRYGKKHKVTVIIPPKPKRVTQSKISAIKSLKGVKIPTITKAPTKARTKIAQPKQIKPKKQDTKTLREIAELYAKQYNISVNTFIKQYRRYLPDNDYRGKGLPYDPTAMQEYLNDLSDNTVKKPQKEKPQKEPTREIEEQISDYEKQPPETEIDVTEIEDSLNYIDSDLPNIFDNAIDNFKSSVANYQTEAPELVRALNDIIDVITAEGGRETTAMFLDMVTAQYGDIDQIMYYGLGRSFDFLRKMSGLLRTWGYSDLAESLDAEIKRYEETDTINFEITDYSKGIQQRKTRFNLFARTLMGKG